MKSLFCAITIVFLSLNLFAQDVERVFIHTDKDIYKAGESVWFKAYVTLPDNKPSDQSILLYVTMEHNDTSVFEGVYSLNEGIANGDILVPKSLNNMDLSFTAYTDVMKNKGQVSGHFTKKIHIRNTKLNKILADLVFDTILDNKLLSTLSLKNHFGIEIEQQKFEWFVKDENELIESGKAITDENGKCKLTVPFYNKGSEPVLSIVTKSGKKDFDFSWRIPNSKSILDVMFFPEGGKMIEGVESKIAFKIFTPDGRGVDVEGEIVDGEGNLVKKIKTIYGGMGEFYIKPKAGVRYFAILNHPKANSFKYDLPSVEKRGVALSITHSNKYGVFLSIKKSDDAISDYTLIANLKNQYSYRKKLSFRSDTSIKIPVKNLSAGVMQISLLENEQAVAERVVFVNNHKHLKVELNPFMDTIPTRLKSKLQIKVTDQYGVPVPGNYSLSISRKDNIKSQQSFVNYLFLKEHLRGYVDGLDVVFTAHQEASKILDLIMLTNGWRSFESKKEAEESYVDHFITGRVTNMRGKVVDGAEVMFMNPRNLSIVNVKADEQGYFALTTMDYLSIVDNSKITVSANIPNSNKKLKIELNPIFGGSFQASVDQQIYSQISLIQEQIEEFVISDSIDDSRDIEEVVVTAKKRNAVSYEERKKKYVVREMDEVQIDQSVQGEKAVEQILQSFGAGYTVLGGKALTRGYSSFTPGHETGIVVVVDGIPYGDNIAELTWLNARDIQNAKLIRGGTAGLKYGGLNARSGILEITLKDPINELSRLNNLAQGRNLGIDGIQGLEEQRVFNNLPGENENTPDLRTTLFWDANIEIDKTGMKEVIFKAGSISGEYECIINGISEIGYPGSNQVSILVK